MKNRFLWGGVLSLLLIAGMVFLPVLRNGFVNWDDPTYIRDNIRIRDLAPAGLARIFTTQHQHIYKPLTELSFALEYRFFGLDPFIYHLDNLLLHLANCLLVFWLIRRIGRSVGVAFFAALLFAIHPLRVESVAWATERKDVLYGFFFLGSLIAYLYYQVVSSGKRYALTLLLFALSLLVKGQGLTLPLLLLLFDWFRGRGWGARVRREKIPFFLLSGLFFYINFIGQVAAGTFQGFGFSRALANLGYAFYGPVFYLLKLAFPVRLSAFYPFPSAGDRLYLLSPAIAATLLLAAVYSLRRTRKIVFAFLFFLINLAIVLQVVPTGPAVAADRYTYIAALGLYYLAAETAIRLGRSGRIRKFGRIGLLIALITAVLAFSLLTWTRCRVWRDSLSLWDDVLLKYPSLAAARLNRGLYFEERGDPEAAIAAYREVLRLAPGEYRAHNNLGNVLAGLDRLPEAIFHYEQALGLKPDFPEALNNLGGAFLKLGDLAAAESCFENAWSSNPDSPEAAYNLGVLRLHRQRPEEAAEFFLRALRLKPDFLPPRRDLVGVLIRKGDPAAAARHAGEFLRCRPGDAGVRNLLGVALSEQGLSDAALEQYREALRLAPGSAEVHNNLGVEYSRRGDYSAAVRRYREALRLQPDYPEAWNNLGLDLAALGETAEAIASYRAALELDPGYAAARLNLADALATEKRKTLE